MKKNDPISLPNPDAARVKARVDLVSYFAQFTRLRPAGNQLVGLCPLHRERHSSFFVDPAQQVFFCHGCQRGGDVFSFVMFRRGCSFPEAVREVARSILPAAVPKLSGPKGRVVPQAKPKAKPKAAPRFSAVRAHSWATPHRGEPKAMLVGSEPRDLPPSFFAEVASRDDVLRYQRGETAVMNRLVSSLVQQRITDFSEGDRR